MKRVAGIFFLVIGVLLIIQSVINIDNATTGLELVRSFWWLLVGLVCFGRNMDYAWKAKNE